MAHAQRLPDLDSFAERLSWGMKKAGLKNPDVAKAVATTAETVSRWRGGGPADESRYEPIAALLRARGMPVTGEWLRSGEQPSVRDSDLAPGELLKEERLWLARFRAQLVELDASPEAEQAAEALVLAPEVLAFYRTLVGSAARRVAAMGWIGEAVRAKVADYQAPFRITEETPENKAPLALKKAVGDSVGPAGPDGSHGTGAKAKLPHPPRPRGS